VEGRGGSKIEVLWHNFHEGTEGNQGSPQPGSSVLADIQTGKLLDATDITPTNAHKVKVAL
jgi:hypothetical protein